MAELVYAYGSEPYPARVGRYIKKTSLPAPTWKFGVFPTPLKRSHTHFVWYIGEPMNLQQSINRGLNLLGTSIVALAGFASVSEIFLEDMVGKIDDIALLLLAVYAIFWYLRADNRYTRSKAPVVLVMLAFLAEAGGFVLEFRSIAASGDDFGGLALLAIAAGFMLYQYAKTKRLLTELVVS